MEQVKILMTEFVTHNVKRFILEKPKDFKFIPGQATDVSINLPEWKGKMNSFTFTSLPNDLVLEFTIKGYKERNGATKKLHSLLPGDKLILHDVFGTINYKGEGVFIAGGAGITPFIAILRDLKNKNELGENMLMFSNKLQKDVILEKEFREMFDKDKLVLTLTQEEKEGYEYGRVNEELLKKYILDFDQNFYICGPDQFVSEIKEILEKLGAKSQSIIIEK